MVRGEPTVATPNAAFEKMRKEGQWELLDTLRAGTEAMREKGTTFLPKNKAEEQDQYIARKRRTFLYMAYDDTISNIASGPFNRELTYVNEEVLDERLQLLGLDADGDGTAMSDFAMSVFDDALHYGLTHFLVDLPGDMRDMSLAEERKLRMHPYFVHIPASQLFAWRTKRMYGREVLVHARWYEYRTVDVGDWQTEEQQLIREWNAPVEGEVGTWRLWKQTDKKDDWLVEEEGTHTYPGVPIVTLYTQRRGFMSARPPFLKLGELNLEHWQKSSDKNNSQHYVLTPMLFRKGITHEEEEDGIVVGVQEVHSSSNENSDMKWVETTGKSIELAEGDLLKIEQRMMQLAAEPFMRRTGDATATGRALDSVKQHSLVQTWVRRLESALRNGYAHAAIWLSSELPEDFSLNIYSSGLSPLLQGGNDIRVLEAARTRRDLDFTTWVEEMQRRGVLDEMVTAELIQERLQEEPDALPAFELPDEDEEEDEVDALEE